MELATGKGKRERVRQGARNCQGSFIRRSRYDSPLDRCAPEGAPAYFVAALSLCWPDGHCESFEGRVDGRLTFPPRGEKGFGYDPIFIPEGSTITFGEMSPENKHAISHRARAFERMIAAGFAGSKAGGP